MFSGDVDIGGPRSVVAEFGAGDWTAVDGNMADAPAARPSMFGRARSASGGVCGSAWPCATAAAVLLLAVI